MHVFLIILGLIGIILSMVSAAIIWSQICCKAKEAVVEKKAGFNDIFDSLLMIKLQTK